MLVHGAGAGVRHGRSFGGQMDWAGSGLNLRRDCHRPPVAVACRQQILRPIQFQGFARHSKLVEGLTDV